MLKFTLVSFFYKYHPLSSANRSCQQKIFKNFPFLVFYIYIFHVLFLFACSVYVFRDDEKWLMFKTWSLFPFYHVFHIFPYMYSNTPLCLYTSQTEVEKRKIQQFKERKKWLFIMYTTCKINNKNKCLWISLLNRLLMLLQKKERKRNIYKYKLLNKSQQDTCHWMERK